MSWIEGAGETLRKLLALEGRVKFLEDQHKNDQEMYARFVALEAKVEVMFDHYLEMNGGKPPELSTKHETLDFYAGLVEKERSIDAIIKTLVGLHRIVRGKK